MKKLLSAIGLTAAFALAFLTKSSAQNMSVTISGEQFLNTCQSPCGFYYAAVQGGAQPYAFSWSFGGPGGTIVGAGNSSEFVFCPPFSSPTGGTYLLNVVVTDANGNQSEAEIAVVVLGGLGPQITVIKGDACNGCDGFAYVAPDSTSGGGFCNILWSNGSTSPQINNLCPGTYSVTVSACNSQCTTTETVIIAGGGGGRIVSTNKSPCNDPDSLGLDVCEKVCPGQTIDYFFQSAIGTTQPPIWVISGAQNFTISPNGQSVSVTWPATGGGIVFASLDNSPSGGGCGSDTLCVQVVDAPVPQANTAPAAVGGVITVCEGQTVFFENTSLNAAFFEWDFGDFSPISESKNVQHAWAVAGLYEVKLIAKSPCLCADTAVFQVFVQQGDAPELDCVGTVCAGTEVSYSTSNSCGNYQWTVAGGTVTGGGGPTDQSVSVNWTTGTTGQISLLATSCSPAVCAEAAIFQIPIIQPTAQIEGDARICFEEEATYEIEPFGGASFVWSVSGGGTITEGQGTNRIKIQWTATPNQAVTHTVSVVYENCYLECGGSASLGVKILPRYKVVGPLEACAGDASTFSSQLLGAAGVLQLDWEAKNLAGVVVFSANNLATTAVNWPATASGQHFLNTVPSDPTKTCTDEFSVAVAVKAPPAAPSGIAGTTPICPGEPYTYSITGAAPAGANVFWTIQNGTLNSNQGLSVAAVWASGNGPFNLAAKSVSADGLGCSSSNVVFSVQKIPAPVVAGTAQVCAETESNYTTSNVQDLDYEWFISPSDAGSVSDGQGTSAAKIFWHKAGAASVTVQVCGQTSAAFAVNVLALPDPVAVFPAQLCQNATAAVSTTAPFSSYFWKNVDGQIVSNLAAPQLGPGHFEVEVIDADGCRGDSTFSIGLRPAPEVVISSPDLEFECLGPVRIYATDTDEGLDFAWLKNGAAVGTNASLYIDSDAANYQVIVTDNEGCTAASNILVIQTCGGGGGGGTPGGGSICNPGELDFTITPTAFCNQRQYDGLILGPNVIAGTEKWLVDWAFSGSGLSHFKVHPQAGYKKIFFVAGFSGGSTCGVWKADSVSLAADFSFEEACEGQIWRFEDLTTFLPPTNIAGWEWNFGDPTTGAANISTQKSPTHTFSASGNFTVELKVTSTTGCISTIQKMISVAPLPVLAIIPPTTNCAGNALEFTAAGADLAKIATFSWDFDDAASGAANEATVNPAFHNFENAGNYAVNLQVKTILGCVANFSMPQNVVANPLAGAITTAPASGKFCEGSTAVLTAPAGATAWEWSDGSTASTTTATASGSFSVTLTDANGCTFSPATVSVEQLPAPDAEIKSIEKNDLGQEIGVAFSPIERCAGEDIFLSATGAAANYSFAWSDGTTGAMNEFSDARGNLLPVGSHMILLTVTNTATGCTATVAPFDIEINPVPAAVSIMADQTGQLCGHQNLTISVQNPVAGQSYQWNTGQTGAFLMMDEAGNYSVIASNVFGCQTKSNTIQIEPGAPIDAVPTGCLTRCLPDTMCIVAPPNLASIEWFLNGQSISNLLNPIFTQSGSYTAILTASNGCTAEAGPLNLELVQGFGDIVGSVLSDVDHLGTINPPTDTTIAFLPIYLFLKEAGVVIDSAKTNPPTGQFKFNDVANGNYTVCIDTSRLPAGWSPIYWCEDVFVQGGCEGNDTFQILFLLEKCPPTVQNLSFSACSGSFYDFFGTPIAAGASQIFNFQTAAGCDSVVNVAVAELLPTTSTVNLTACAGGFATFNGNQIAAGSSQNFTLPNAAGCDSTVTVSVGTLPLPTPTALVLTACSGEKVIFKGQEIPFGQSITDTLQSAATGCDSVVVVTAVEKTAPNFDLILTESCPSSPTGTAVIENTAGLGLFQFSKDGGATWQAAPVFENLPTGPFSILMTDSTGCETEEKGEILAIEKIQIDAPEVFLPCDSALMATLAGTFSGGGTVEIGWFDEKGVRLDSALLLTVTQPASYLFQAKNECETVEKSVAVRRDPSQAETVFFAPNAFLPESKNGNEKWRLFWADDVLFKNYELVVFDRWGEPVFRTNDPTATWDGLFKDKKLRPSVVVWQVEAKATVCGEEREFVRKGDVTVIR